MVKVNAIKYMKLVFDRL